MSKKKIEKDILAKQQAVVANTANQQVGNTFGIHGWERFRADLLLSSTVVAAGVNAILQISPFSNNEASDEVDGSGTGARVWITAKTVAITNGSTVCTIVLNPETALDLPFLPLPTVGRILITTGAGDTLTVVRAVVLQPVN